MQVVKIAIFAAAMATLFGCTSGNVEKHFGESYAEINRQMIANPKAGSQPDDGVTELEGETVENVMSGYRKGQTSTKSGALPESILLSTSGRK